MKTTNVYFVENADTHYIKIGKSKEPLKRLQALQTGNASNLRILYTINNVDDSFETFLHGICEGYRMSGEWFRPGVLKEHLLKHPWYKKHLKPFRVIKKKD